MVDWAIGIEVGDARADGEGLLRLLAIFERDFPNFVADRAFSSGRLVVHGTVESDAPGEAVSSALATISDAFDVAGIDERGTAEVMSVTLDRAERAASTESDWPSVALLRRIRNQTHPESPGEDFVVAREHPGEPEVAVHMIGERSSTGAERRFHVEHFRGRLDGRFYELGDLLVRNSSR